MINEYFLYFKDTLFPVFLKLFNVIFDLGYMPKQWRVGIIVPVDKG